MNLRNTITRLCLFLLLGPLALPMAAVTAASPAGPAAPTATSCAFGYAFQSRPAAWVEIKATGTALPFPLGDDSTVQVPALPFSFPFFENAYTQVQVSTNGYIAFGTQSASAYPGNLSLPSEVKPNNLIAAFWDDLTVGETYKVGAVYFQVLGSSPDRTAVFEWDRVTRLGTSATLSFEIVLSENGTIALNYGELAGVLDQATVGIDDLGGIDGCQLVYNSSGLASNTSYRLLYPPAGPRVKASPSYQGQFLVNGTVDLPITLTNTGTTTDTYHFQIDTLSGANDWQLQVLNTQKTAISNTPSLASKQSYSAWVRVTSAASAWMGAYVRSQVSVISNTNPSKMFSLTIDAAIPVPFMIFYVDSSTAYLRHSLPQYQITNKVFDSFTGKAFSLARTGSQSYLASWEYIRQGSGNNYANIQKAVTGPTEGTSTVTDLLDNSIQPNPTRDASPVTAVAPGDEKVGLAFVRVTLDESYKQQSNIYFARLDARGTLLPPAYNLTQNLDFDRDQIYDLPTIASAGADRFVVAYQSMTLEDGVATARDIDLVVISLTGAVLTAPYHLTASLANSTEFYAPSAVRMSNGDVMIAFQAQPNGVTDSQIQYTIYRSASNSLDPISTLDGAVGVTPRLATLTDGSLFLAWVQAGAQSIGYTLFNSAGVLKLASPQEISAIGGGAIENLSVTGEVNGRAILSWKDNWEKFLYYALVDPDGTLVTPPMAFLEDSDPSSPNLKTSGTGMGIAALPNNLFWYYYLPTIRR